ncbi:tRNA (adenosine(37)-N6)-threonylcarbamoyltransferase complex ATPase subunit type 1 TsaE [Candidatus Wolfebacteria bacterium]|nr:tRNA (adenosine(37)-N6)-threonylcarbamoyltransferase complex ATPase subunit type 1 TsaE [Candidatus Wolfebacteria bacterium]
MLSKSRSKTQKLAKEFAKELLKGEMGKSKYIHIHRGAEIILLKGELGSAKTTFTQSFLKTLGVDRNISSPTFVIARRYFLTKLQKNKKARIKFKNAYHFDLYRIKSVRELEVIDFKKIIKDSDNLVLIEWPEKAKRLLPKKDFTEIIFKHGKNKNERNINIKYK